MAKIYWLASYPKSGNTWLRIFLTNYWRNAATPADINDLESTPIASSRVLFANMAGIEAADLTIDEIDCIRPAVYRTWAASQPEDIFSKVHDAYRYVATGQPLFPPDVTAGAIYLVRNPLDVALSMAAHNGLPVDRTIDQMASAEYTLGVYRSGISEQLHQKLGAWGSHVQSWLAAAAHFPLLLVRYEDLYVRSVTEFAAVLRFIGADVDPARLLRAIEFSRFEQVQAQERTHGFNERPGTAQQFFASGTPGRWRTALNPTQIARIIADHRDTMRVLGYLPQTENNHEQ